MNRRGFIGLMLCCALLFTPGLSFASFGSLEGYVTDEETGQGIYGAVVRLTIAPGVSLPPTTTIEGGLYQFVNTVPPGTNYVLTVTKTGYYSYSGICPQIIAGQTARKDVVLTPNPGMETGTLSGVVYDDYDDPLMGVRVTVNFMQTMTDLFGQYQFTLGVGSYPVQARLDGFLDYDVPDIPVFQDETTIHDIHMVQGIIDAYAGAYQWGESRNSNGILTIGDAEEMAAEIAQAGQGDYSACFTPDPLIQDLDGDNVLGPGDQAILAQWLSGDWSDIPAEGVPDRIERSPATTQISIDGGELLRVSVENSITGNARAGWGTVFAIDRDLTTCETATLFGRPFPTIAGTGHDYRHNADAVFEYSLSNGFVSTYLTAIGCEIDDQIVVDVFIPGDSEAGIWGERFPSTLHGDESFSLTVVEGGGGGLCFIGAVM